jgi:hypothetical protein
VEGMDYYQKEPSNKPKSRKWLGCLIGCLIVFGFFLLFCIFIAWLLFRAYPSIPEEKFFSPEVTGFARFQIDAMQRGPARDLLQNLISQTTPPSQDREIRKMDPEGLWTAFDLILHKRHYLYLYNGQDRKLEYLLVIDLKRFHWLLNSFFKGANKDEVQEISLPKGAKGRCYRLKGVKGDKYIAITNTAFFISDSEDRIKNAVILVRSKNTPQELAPSVKNLLPSDNPDDMVNGFLLWREDFTDAVYTWTLDKNKELETIITPIYQVLSEEKVDGVQMKCGLSSTDVLKVSIGIRCTDEAKASQLAENLTMALNKEEIPQSLEKSCVSTGNMVQIEILVPGVESWLKDKFKE